VNVAIRPKYISLFAGAGGLELAVRLALPAAQCVCYVEREVEAAGILAARIRDQALDDAPIWSDVCTFDGKPWRGLVVGIVGGFPCTDLSVAGKREGIKRGNQSGLFYEYARIIREVEPRWVYIENVPAVLAFPAGGIVLGELAKLGFDAEWGTLRASDVGASHKRRRCFVLAYRDSAWGLQPHRGIGPERRRIGYGSDDVANSTGRGRHEVRSKPEGIERGFDASQPCVEMAYADGERRGEARGVQCGENSLPARSSADVDNAAMPRFRTRQCSAGGEICDATWRTQPCGRCDVVAYSGCDALRRSTGRTEEIERRPCAEVAGSGAELAYAGSIGGPSGVSGSLQRYEGNAGISEYQSNAMVFAPGPAHPIWNDVLVRDYGMRPALSQAEAESCFRRVADGMASPLDQRIDRLRACGNGVVPVQGAAAFRELVRRISTR